MTRRTKSDPSDRRPFPRVAAAVLLAIAMFAAACSGSATVTDTGDAAGGTAEPGPESTTRPTSPAQEPTAVPNLDPDEATSGTDATNEPTPTPADPGVALPAESFRTDNILAISDTGAHAYAGTSSPWNNPTSCTSAAHEALAVVEIEAGLRGEIAPVGGGLNQTGDIRQLLVGPDNQVAILSSCGPSESSTVWMQYGELGANGRLVTVGEVLPLGDAEQRDPYLSGWVDDDTVEVLVTIEVDPDDFDSWLIERRQVAIRTGEIVAVEQFSYFDDDGFGTRQTRTTAQGFTYRVVDDPQGRFGCEGFGVAVTLALDDGANPRLALSQPDFVFSDVSNLHTSVSDHIAWTSACEGFVTAYVGKILDDGTIADAHFIDTFSVASEAYVDFQYYRLTNDGFLVAIGQSFDSNNEQSTLEFLRYDLATDPNFVNTAEPAPAIDAAPLFDAVGGDGTWHVGETLAADPACGARTLYGKTAGGFVRAFPAGIEIDAIVDVDLGPTRTIDYEDGAQFISRTVVVQTECPGQYEGRRVWFGLEADQIIWGLSLGRADLVEVANVLSVRDVLQQDSDFLDTSFVEVELLDGTVTEVELVTLPSEG